MPDARVSNDDVAPEVEADLVHGRLVLVLHVDAVHVLRASNRIFSPARCILIVPMRFGQVALPLTQCKASNTAAIMKVNSCFSMQQRKSGRNQHKPLYFLNRAKQYTTHMPRLLPT